MKEVKVGALALIAGTCFVLIVLNITSSKTGFGTYYDYYANIEDATGIFENSVIRVAGIEAGYIKKIELNDDKAKITFGVQKRLKVTQNSTLKVKTVGFLGEKYLDLSLGVIAPERLPEGSEVKVLEGAGFEALAEDAAEIAVDVKEITQKVKEALKSDTSDNIVKDIIADLQKTMQTVRKIAERNETKINEIVDNVGDVSASLAYELDSSQEGSLLYQVRDIGPTIKNLKAASEDIKAIVADVYAGKGTVGKLLRDDETIEQVNSTLRNVNQLVNRINNIEADLALYTGVNSDDGTSTTFDVDLYPAPERFYRLGVVVNDFGPEVSETKRTTTTPSGGSSSTETTEEVNEDAIKFNLQIARVFQRFVFRAGLIESTGGVGVDYLWKEQSMRFSAEAFDFANDNGANLRLMTDFKIWNIIYSRISLEDVLNDTRSATIFLGLKFTDEDLAALIGLAAN